MCPFCVISAATLIAGTASIGGFAAIVLKRKSSKMNESSFLKRETPRLEQAKPLLGAELQQQLGP